MLQDVLKYSCDDYLNLSTLEKIRDDLQNVKKEEICCREDAKKYVESLRMFRESSARSDNLKGARYAETVRSLLSVGEDGVYSDNLRFVFELIQNVDDCDYDDPTDCNLDIQFDFNNDKIVLTYNETGFTPFNVFSITGTAEAAKNISSEKEEIGEKGIGFKSVFGVADRALIESGWFSFSLYKDNYTVPIFEDSCPSFPNGTRMTLFMPGKTKRIYEQLRDRYSNKDALFINNPILFLNKLTHLKLYYDSFRCIEFSVPRVPLNNKLAFKKEPSVFISVKFGKDPSIVGVDSEQRIKCIRYSQNFVFSENACKSRYGKKTEVGKNNGKKMRLQVIFPYPEYLNEVENGGLYSFLPTKTRFSVPIVCHVPFKLGASREFVDSEENNLWFQESCDYMRKLLDSALVDWRFVVKEEIIRYIPHQSKSLITSNNGKEKCLSELSCFEYSHYASMPLLLTASGEYRKTDEVFCFYPNHLKTDPAIIATLSDYSKSLYLQPEGVNPTNYGIQVESNPLKRLYINALKRPNITERAFGILEEESFDFNEREKQMPSAYRLSYSQIKSIFHFREMSGKLKRIYTGRIQWHDYKNLICVQEGNGIKTLEKVLYKDFDISETPEDIARYLKSINSNCVCLDIPEHDYLPCSNLLVLAKENPISSFSAFCFDVDHGSFFTARLCMKEASERLNRAVEENKGTEYEFLDLLRENRRYIKDALGDRGYSSYINLINRSGTDRNRFIQEILQNADDCLYPEGIVPSFKLDVRGDTITASYNECGFTRANIRSITAIGESTKNIILNGETTIGEKGVGFKTIFAIASSVTITSGNIGFKLTAQEPTIPKTVEMTSPVSGTRMEILLKPQIDLPSYSEKEIVELCLCLRKLRKLTINDLEITIDDNEQLRTITSKNRTRVFRKYHHEFVITDVEALKERESGIYKAIPKQDIYCYVPTKAMEFDYRIYSGLPTKHKLNIPMVIDAPFMLTTSREQIDLDSRKWNGIVIREIYKAIISVMHASKDVDRIGVLRFARYRTQGFRNYEDYLNNCSDFEFFNSVDFADQIKTEKILPTYDKSTYVSADSNVFRFPLAVTMLLDRQEGTEAFDLSIVLDERTEVITKEQRERMESVLKAIHVKEAEFRTYVNFLSKFAPDNMDDKDFRERLYELLEDAPIEFKKIIREWAIIPVYNNNGDTCFIPWEEDKIFVKPGTTTKADDYDILNERILPKSQCEKILGVNINVMNRALQMQKYNKKLGEILKDNDMEMIYYFLLQEYNSGNLESNNSFGLLFEHRESIPLKNQLGEITDTELFLCNQPNGCLNVKMIQQKVVNSECQDFARRLRCNSIETVYYEDLEYYEVLTADDIECLQSNFQHSEEILRGFYRDGYIPEELIEEYGLRFLELYLFKNNEVTPYFPAEPPGNQFRLQEHVAKLFQNLIKIESVIEPRTVKKGVGPNGELFDLKNEDIRKGALRRYSPEGSEHRCFCQMCKKAKLTQFIEVNNIELNPEYYFPELRVALCLECSKIFEQLRNYAPFRKKFIENIIGADLTYQTTISIPIGGDYTITFTGKHLSEIKEILRRKEGGLPE